MFGISRFANSLAVSPSIWPNVKQLNYFDNDLVDQTGNASFTLNSGTLSTAQSKFGGYSLNFASGTNPWFTNAALGFGTGDFTIEGFVYNTGGSGGNRAVIQFDSACIFGFNPNGAWRWDGTNFDITTEFGASNVWHHVAWYRSSGVQYIAINGITQAVRTGDTKSISAPSAGTFFNDAYGDVWTGYLDSLRIANVSVYGSSNFTPPSSEFPNS